MTLLALCALAFLAGFIDSAVGGGGLVQVPALLLLRPDVPTATLFGTNKFSSVFGTANAARRYAQQIRLPWRTVGPMAVAAFAASFLGARVVSLMNPATLKPLVLGLMLAVLIYTLCKKDLGQQHAPQLSAQKERWAGLAFGGLLGFYDGFFGPGTGSFLIFGFVGWFGYSFLVASAAAKLVNLATNAAALAWFIPHQQVLYATALPMAACNVAGSWLGTHLAIKKGSAFVRLLFIGVVSALLARLAWDVLSPLLHS